MHFLSAAIAKINELVNYNNVIKLLIKDELFSCDKANESAINNNNNKMNKSFDTSKNWTHTRDLIRLGHQRELMLIDDVH